MLHIRLGLGTKIQLKLTILIFWTEFAQKGYFQSKTEKSHFHVRSWLSLTISNFSVRGTTDTMVF